MDKREQLIDIMEEAAKGETKATLRARIAELEAENARLLAEQLDDAEMIKREAIAGWKDAEAISRIGAVKVTCEELHRYIDRCREMPNGGEYSWWSRLADTLSALEPAAPEGQQEAVDWKRVDDALVSCAGLLRTLCRDNIGDTAAAELEYVRSVVGRPAEQEVTEAMVEAAVQAVRPYTLQFLFIDEHRELVRAALKGDRGWPER